MLAREKFFMTNLKIDFPGLIKKLTLIFICFYPAITFSSESELITAIEKSWNETNTMIGRFHQLSDDNKTVSGDFFIHKPFQSKFTYDNNLQTIITSKFFVSIIDQDRNLIDRYPIINQPIYEILSDKISFEKVFNILSIDTKNEEVVLNLVSKNNSEGVGIKINLTFDEKDYLLKNWEIIYELGQSTFLEFTKIRKNISIGSDLFIIK